MRERHVVLTDDQAHGFQYGTQLHFEDEIVRLTGAVRTPAPVWRAPSWLARRLSHGTRYAPLRRFVPRTQQADVPADVVWVVLMGPENTDLDLLARWDKKSGYRILYLFDTFPAQLPAIRRIVGAVHWDLTVTSFHCTVPLLERETGRKWHAVPQGVIPCHFEPLPAVQRSIAVSSYGRRLASTHAALARWSEQAGLYYETSVASAVQRDVDSRYLYRQYAWHLRRSNFSVCWPVELTHPHRAAGFSAVTCRWFECAASGVPMIGRAPRDPVFEELFGADAVIPVDPEARSSVLTEQLEQLWCDREHHVARALERRAQLLPKWTWERAVRQLLQLAALSPKEPAHSDEDDANGGAEAIPH